VEVEESIDEGEEREEERSEEVVEVVVVDEEGRFLANVLLCGREEELEGGSWVRGDCLGSSSYLWIMLLTPKAGTLGDEGVEDARCMEGEDGEDEDDGGEAEVVEDVSDVFLYL
jgi:hypothetical protein